MQFPSTLFTTVQTHRRSRNTKLSYNVWEFKSTNYMCLGQTAGHLLRALHLAVPTLSALHTSSHIIFNTMPGGSNPYSMPFYGEHLGSRRTRSLPRGHSRNTVELGFECCRHRHHSREQEESRPGEADTLSGPWTLLCHST